MTSFSEKIEPYILMSSSSHIQSVLIGVEYQNCCQTLDVYLLFALFYYIAEEFTQQKIGLLRKN